MIPDNFEQQNTTFKSPPEMPESCQDIKAFLGQAMGGVFDGAQICVTAWKPDAAELARLNQGGAVFLTVIGGLPPHRLSTSFKDATA